MRRTTGAHTNKLKQDKESEVHVESLDPTLSPPDPYQNPSGCGGSIIMFLQLVLPFFCAYIFVLMTTDMTLRIAEANGGPIFLPMLVASLIVILGVGILVRRHVEQQEQLFWRIVQERNQALFHSMDDETTKASHQALVTALEAQLWVLDPERARKLGLPLQDHHHF